MQAGLGDASATAHRAAELPSVLGVLQAEEHCNSHTIPAQLSLSCILCPAASSASQGFQGSGARLQGALGFKQVFLGNLIPRAAAS